MSISTKRGDDGQTSLLFGKRVSKNHARVWAYGSVDELGSALGICRSHTICPDIKEKIKSIQLLLMPMMSELATDGANQPKFFERAKVTIEEEQVDILTGWIDQLEAESGGFKGWECPGDTSPQAYFDMARTVCRRAERYIVALTESGAKVRPVLGQYLNRLSDLLWLWAREHSHEDMTSSAN